MAVTELLFMFMIKLVGVVSWCRRRWWRDGVVVNVVVKLVGVVCSSLS